MVNCVGKQLEVRYNNIPGYVCAGAMLTSKTVIDFDNPHMQDASEVLYRYRLMLD
jgi:hypothetical protein